MSRILLVLCLMIFSVMPSFSLENIKYKNLESGTKIFYDGNSWTTRFDKKNDDYYIKQTSEGVAQYSDFYSKSGDFLFSTATQYEFIHKGDLIGYSNNDLKFYEFYFQDGYLAQRELLYDEVKELFPDYKVITIRDFTLTTNCLKVKKKRKDLKLILLNDTDEYYDNYRFTSGNAQFKEYPLKGFLRINKKGMIQFSRRGENTKNSPWYVLLVR